MERVKFLAMKSIWKESTPMNEKPRFNEISFFLFAVLRNSHQRSWTSRKFYQLGRWHQVKNFQSYSVIVVKSKEKESSFTTFFLKKDSPSVSSFSSLLGCKPRWKKLSTMSRISILKGWTTLLITSADAALAAQNRPPLAAESRLWWSDYRGTATPLFRRNA